MGKRRRDEETEWKGLCGLGLGRGEFGGVGAAIRKVSGERRGWAHNDGVVLVAAPRGDLIKSQSEMTGAMSRCPACSEGTLLRAGDVAICFDCGQIFAPPKLPPRKSDVPGHHICIKCGPRPREHFDRYNSGRVWDPACRTCRDDLRIREQRRRDDAWLDAQAYLRELERKRIDEIVKARLEEEDARRRLEASRLEAERERRAREEARRVREREEQRARDEAAAREEAERLQVQLEGIRELAWRAAHWPGATEEQVDDAAQKLCEYMSLRCDELVKDCFSAKNEARAIEVGQSVAEVGGTLAALASVLGRVHPLIGIAGVVIAAVAEPVAKDLSDSRAKSYQNKWRAIILGLREPDRDLFLAVLALRHPAVKLTVSQMLQ